MKTPTHDWEADFVEKAAALEHERWARWQQHVHNKCELLGDASLAIPKTLVDRWTHQISRDYKHLTEQEKESDRKEVREYLPLVRAEIEAAEKRGKDSQKELLESLVLMYEQYCQDGHAFMTAGEAASSTLENYGYSFDEVGRIIATPTNTV